MRICLKEIVLAVILVMFLTKAAVTLVELCESHHCGDYNKSHDVTEQDFLILLSQTGQNAYGDEQDSRQKKCMDLYQDGRIDLVDVLLHGVLLGGYTNICPQEQVLTLDGLEESGRIVFASSQNQNQPVTGLLLAGRTNARGYWDDYVVNWDTNEPVYNIPPSGEGSLTGMRLVAKGYDAYQLDAFQGLVALRDLGTTSDDIVVLSPAEKQFDGNSIRVGVGTPLLDVVFDRRKENEVIVVPVEDYTGTRYVARLRLLGGGEFEILRLYDHPEPNPKEVELTQRNHLVVMSETKTVIHEGDGLVVEQESGFQTMLVSEHAPVIYTVASSNLPDGNVQMQKSSMGGVWEGALEIMGPPVQDYGAGIVTRVVSLVEKEDGTLIVVGYSRPGFRENHSVLSPPFDGMEIFTRVFSVEIPMGVVWGNFILVGQPMGLEQMELPCSAIYVKEQKQFVEVMEWRSVKQHQGFWGSVVLDEDSVDPRIDPHLVVEVEFDSTPILEGDGVLQGQYTIVAEHTFVDGTALVMDFGEVPLDQDYELNLVGVVQNVLGDSLCRFRLEPGDLNEDGQTNTIDQAMAKSRLGESALTDARFDVNTDGRINMIDVALVKALR